MKVRNSGFTLVELMVVVAIIGILTAIVMPSYNENVRRTKRADAASALVQLSQAMERYFSANYTYLGAAAAGVNIGAPASTTFTSTQSPLTGAAAYNLTISAATATSYTLSATPTGGHVGDACGIMTLTNTNAKGDGGAAGERCWR
tara:strand:+ start:1697 stop:2134 length:438 start_codon:yes stop_codon:yes gene_type:complete